MWIESHQELGAHPKTLKLARILGIPRAQVVGHLHYLWWWSVDYAQDGSLAKFESLDIAIGGDWAGEPDVFVQGLVRAGFVDDADGVLSIHDWDQYIGRLLEARRRDAERKRNSRAAAEMSAGCPPDVRVTAGVTVPNLTVPNLTVPDSTGPGDSADKPAPKSKRAAKLPADFEVTDRMRDWAYGDAFTDTDIERETPCFVDHFTANGKAQLDWVAAWRNWMRRSRKYAAPVIVGSSTNGKQGDRALDYFRAEAMKGQPA